MEFVLSMLAVFISVGTLLWTIWFNLRQQQSTALVQSLTAFIGVEQKLAYIPAALQFHGVNPDELTKIGITPEEFSYLLTSFTAGGIFYRIKPKVAKKPYAEGTYRYTMLKSEKTQRAWPILRKFLEPSPYRDRIELTLEVIRADDNVRKDKKLKHYG